MKKSLIAGNWKMYKTPKESIEFVNSLIKNLKDYEDRDVLICPPFTSLYPISQIIKNSKLKLGAQNVYFENEGAFTGEISPIMLKDIGVEYVICGHSERRNIFGETDEIINKKVKKVVETGMKAILCVGEKLEEREKGETFKVVESQVKKCLEGFDKIEEIVIAYEPVWAIGTGKTAQPHQAEEVHIFIRELISKIYNKDIAENLIILYGGSVKPENIDQLMKEKNIDGVLVGGACLKIDSFLRIIDYRR
ncbi:MAG: triose-phosphate isomerase [bacterium]|nr:triose-phosphate isomerase [bacterium]MCX7917195.1 triose-phosphate isomerase [bacterium]MDW8163257.1 triose-phosphate isomerase [Candidatus Omnitrophota bacterium]